MFEMPLAQSAWVNLLHIRYDFMVRIYKLIPHPTFHPVLLFYFSSWEYPIIILFYILHSSGRVPLD